MRRALALWTVFSALAGCQWNWDGYDPRVHDGAVSVDVASDDAVGLDVVVSTDTGVDTSTDTGVDTSTDTGVDTSTDTGTDTGAPTCGTAGAVCCMGSAVCVTGFACLGGRCVQCPTGRSACSGVCVDLQTDMNHCGQCDTVCSHGTRCRSGVCG